MANYAMRIKLEGSFEDVKGKVLQALKTQGFGVLNEIDVQKTLNQKIGVEFKPYQILGACNPHYAYRALCADESIGLLLPCNVVLKQDDDGVEVSIQDPEVMFSVVDEETKASMAGFPQEVRKSLQLALDVLKKPD